MKLYPSTAIAGEARAGTGPLRVRPLRAIERSNRAVWFVVSQIFVTLYLQKLALGSDTFQVRVPMVILATGIVWLVIGETASFSMSRLGLYCALAGSCLVSTLISGFSGSAPSLLQFLLIYAFFAISVKMTEADYLRSMRWFIILMVPPAMIVLVQFSYQKLTGLPDPINMNELLPKTVLLQGFFYNANYPFWYSTFTRPNGFIFLEPSYASEYLALAAIVEVTYFRRPFVILLMISATMLSTGATGMVALLVASPLLLARQSPRLIAICLILVAIGLGVGYATNQLPFLSRVDELGSQSSGSDRMLVPAKKLLELVFDPNYLISGLGAGATTTDFGSAWAVVKLTNQYGLLVALLYSALFVAAILANRENIPMKAALAFVFHVTGGYLFDITAVNFITLTCLCQITYPMHDGSSKHARRLFCARSLRSGRITQSPDASAGWCDPHPARFSQKQQTG